MEVFICEVTICDYPDYTTLFGSPTTSFAEAIDTCSKMVQETIDDLGDDGEVIVKQVGGSQWRISAGDEDCEPYYVTGYKI